MAPRRPVIGICAAVEQARHGVWDQPAVLVPAAYADAVRRAGGLALLLPPDPALADAPDEALDLLDGLLLAGGADIDPGAYGAAPHPATSGTDPVRDAVEAALAQRALARGLPVLGICRGMQLLNVAAGGTLRQHVPDDLGHGEHRRVVGTFEGSGHRVRLAAGSRAAQAAGEQEHTALSHHHQAIDRVGDGWRVTGRSSLDELPEAIERPGSAFALGVQWHPEADPGSPVVAALVAAAGARAVERHAADARSDDAAAGRAHSAAGSAARAT